MLSVLKAVITITADSTGTISCSNLLMADFLTQASLHAGISADYKRVYKNKSTLMWNITIHLPLNGKITEFIVIPSDITARKYIGKVYCLTVPSHVIYVRKDPIVAGGSYPVWCSQSSRTGNKGIASMSFDRMDMPFTDDGVTPDMIVSSQSIPTRMAINQLLECALGILGAKLGRKFDGTVFRRINEEMIMKELETNGVKYGGKQRMYNGRTGQYIDTLIFIGPTVYQRLQKFVLDVNYAMFSGPRNAIFRQPLEGKANNGGLRLGEMEIWCKTAHGASRSIYEKMFDDSDGTIIYVCKNCGDRAIVNENISRYICNRCDEFADIVGVKNSWSCNVFMNILSTMNAKMILKTTQHSTTEQQ